MVIAVIIAVTLITVYIAVLVGLYRDEPEGQVQALNYPVTFVHNPGESWAVRDEHEECLRCGLVPEECRCAFFYHPFPEPCGALTHNMDLIAKKCKNQKPCSQHPVEV